MIPILKSIESLLVRDLGCIKREIEAFPTDADLWALLPGITNPGGTLALHGCGNLRHYVGHVLGGQDYTRDRGNEFANRSMTRQEICDEVDQAIAAVQGALQGVDPSRLSSTYPELVGGFELNTQQFLLHLCTHLSMHAGQLGYLRRILTGDNQTTGPASLSAIAASK